MDEDRSGRRAVLECVVWAGAGLFWTVQGTTVTWTNRDDMPHTVSAGSRPGDFASDALDTGETFTWRFDHVGRFSYFCGLHPRMQGVVTVR